MKIIFETTFAVFLAFFTGVVSPRTLESYNVDDTKISVSGLSSGGAMAVQFHIAFSSSVMGAAPFAGLPFGFSALDDPTNITSVMEFITNAHEQGNIDDPANIQDHNVYVFHGKNDDFVEMKFSVATNQMYTALETKRVESNFTSICGHGMPTLNHGVECNDTWLPGINKCNWMGAYYGTQTIYGDLRAPYGDTPLHGELYEYDQTEFFDGIDGHSLDDVGYIYVPTACKDKDTQCRLHIVFHGCFQGRENLGIEYANSTGYNEVGEMNDIIMLYPQVKSNIDLVNPTGCWDGVGYTGDDHMFKTGKQMRIVRSQIERILG